LLSGEGHYFYIADPLVPDDSNLTIEMLHLTWQYIGKRRAEKSKETGMPVVEMKEMDVQADGCRVNKNKTKWAWMSWLITTKQQLQASDNYMLVGHTHDLMDAILAIVSRWIKKEGLVIKYLADLAKSVIDAFNQREQKSYVRVVVLHSVHDWKEFFDGFAPPIEKIAANIPDIERPHRFELWHDSATDQVHLWYKNLRQKEEYWNKEPLIMNEHGYRDLKELKVATPNNNLVLQRHVKTLAQSRLKFDKVFNLPVPGIKHLLTSADKASWDEYWDLFSVITTERVWIEKEQVYRTKALSKATSDFDMVSRFMEARAQHIELLPLVQAARETLKPRKLVHVVPPVAPLKVTKAGWSKTNVGFTSKCLAAFVDGATDTECVRAARNAIKAAANPIPAKSNKAAAPKKPAAPKAPTAAKSKAAVATAAKGLGEIRIRSGLSEGLQSW